MFFLRFEVDRLCIGRKYFHGGEQSLLKKAATLRNTLKCGGHISSHRLRKSVGTDSNKGRLFPLKYAVIARFLRVRLPGNSLHQHCEGEAHGQSCMGFG